MDSRPPSKAPPAPRSRTDSAFRDQAAGAGSSGSSGNSSPVLPVSRPPGALPPIRTGAPAAAPPPAAAAPAPAAPLAVEAPKFSLGDEEEHEEGLTEIKLGNGSPLAPPKPEGKRD